MLIQRNQAFNAPDRSGGVNAKSFDRHLATNLLVSIYSDVLKEPLPDKLERLVHALEMRVAAIKDR